MFSHRVAARPRTRCSARIWWYRIARVWWWPLPPKPATWTGTPCLPNNVSRRSRVINPREKSATRVRRVHSSSLKRKHGWPTSSVMVRRFQPRQVRSRRNSTTPRACASWKSQRGTSEQTASTCGHSLGLQALRTKLLQRTTRQPGDDASAAHRRCGHCVTGPLPSRSTERQPWAKIPMPPVSMMSSGVVSSVDPAFAGTRLQGTERRRLEPKKGVSEVLRGWVRGR